MTLRAAGLSLSLTWFVLVASAPRAQNATPDPAVFQSQVFPVFEAAKCSGCHSPSGVASVCV